MSLPTDAFELGIALAQALEGHGVEYALGGALAYGQYGISRATNDVDVNVFVAPDGLAPVFEALRALDVPVDEAAARAVFKLLFFRAKDLVDLERLIAVQGGAVDVPYVRARIVEMLGEEDPRVEALDRLCAENMPDDPATA